MDSGCPADSCHLQHLSKLHPPPLVTLDARASTQQSGGHNLAPQPPLTGKQLACVCLVGQPDSWGPACPASVIA